MGDRTVRCIARRLSKLAGFPITDMQPLEITRYTRGQKYDVHTDSTGDERERLRTIFVYLNTVDQECGGSTLFPEIRADGVPLRVKPRKGSALMWENVHDDGSVKVETENAGEPITCDGVTKYGLNVWFEGVPGHVRTTRMKSA